MSDNKHLPSCEMVRKEDGKYGPSTHTVRTACVSCGWVSKHDKLGHIIAVQRDTNVQCCQQSLNARSGVPMLDPRQQTFAFM